MDGLNDREKIWRVLGFRGIGVIFFRLVVYCFLAYWFIVDLVSTALMVPYGI
jgi:hypothetical protein